MRGIVLQVNVSPGGIPKQPIPEGEITTLGVEGDAHAHPEVHGGPEQAVLIVCQEGLDELIAAGFPLFPGALGENLTVQGLDRTQLRSGQRFRAGDAILELTRLRQPCKTLHVYGDDIAKAVFDRQAKDGDYTSPRWGLAGFYASVVRPGRVSPGAPIALLEQKV